jgi:hypothetical protein
MRQDYVPIADENQLLRRTAKGSLRHHPAATAEEHLAANRKLASILPFKVYLYYVYITF